MEFRKASPVVIPLEIGDWSRMLSFNDDDSVDGMWG